jgi:hypothetical protein
MGGADALLQGLNFVVVCTLPLGHLLARVLKQVLRCGSSQAGTRPQELFLYPAEFRFDRQIT